MRAKIIECILSTDMKQHFEDISKFRMRRQSEEFSIRSSAEDRWATLRMCIKIGDLCHTCLPWPDHFNMTCAITEEFYQQGDEVSKLVLRSQKAALNGQRSTVKQDMHLVHLRFSLLLCGN